MSQVESERKAAFGFHRELEKDKHRRKDVKVTLAKFEKYDVSVEERKDTPGAWTVEAIDSDGGIEQAIFAGPNARARADEHAFERYRHSALAKFKS